MILLLLVACHGTEPAPAPGSDDTGDTASPAADDPSFCVDTTYVATAEVDGRWRVQTEHYDLGLATDEAGAVDVARMAEAAWLAWSDELGTSPALGTGERLKAGWYATEAEWELAIAADGDTPPVGAGGYYSPTTRGAYMWSQPTIYYTSTLLLHEMTHQFHLLARTGNVTRAAWYVEGLAEYDSRHDWDGRCLRLGRIPLLTQEDNEAQAAAATVDGLDLPGVLAGTAGDRPVWEAIWRYLVRTPERAEGFAAFRAAYDADAALDVARVFAEQVGDPEDLGLDIAAWIPEAQEPMTPVFLDWVHLGPDSVRVVPGGVLSLARVKDAVTLFSVDVNEGEPGWYGGALVAYDDASNFDAFLIGADDSLWVFASHDGAAIWNPLGTLPTSIEGHREVEITWSETSALVTVDGTQVDVPLGSAPGAGLAAYGADIDFSGIAWD